MYKLYKCKKWKKFYYFGLLLFFTACVFEFKHLCKLESHDSSLNAKANNTKLTAIPNRNHSHNNSICCSKTQCKSISPDRHFIRSQHFSGNANFTPALLYSFPGSGNTWCRLLIEWSTGVYTGSMYDDESLTSVLPGETRCDQFVSVIKGISVSIKIVYPSITAVNS